MKYKLYKTNAEDYGLIVDSKVILFEKNEVMINNLLGVYDVGEEIDCTLHNINIEEIPLKGFFVVCPYSQEIHGDNSYSCNCNDEAQYSCIMDI